MSWSIAEAIRHVRKFHSFNQVRFGTNLNITGSYVSQLESGKSAPSDAIVSKICSLYDVSEKWLRQGEGPPFEDEKKSEQMLVQLRRPIAQKALIAASAVFAPIMPMVSVGLTLGVSADYVLDKMQQAYGVNTLADLAKCKLGVDRTTVNRWIQKNKIPSLYIQKAANDNSINEEYFTTNDNKVEELLDLIVQFTIEQIYIYKKSEVDSQMIKKDLKKLMIKSDN